MSYTQDVEAVSGNSSPSSSPASEDIDMDVAPVSNSVIHASQQHANAPQSPISPKKTAAPASGQDTPSSRMTRQQQQQGQGSNNQPGNRVGQGNSKKRSGHSKYEMREGDESAYGRAMMDPAQSSAYDRLLDLKYPRDYGDPAARYDAAMSNATKAPSSGTSQ